jgi:hypothetical protein
MNKLILTAAVAATVLTIGAANAADASVKTEANTGIVPTLSNTGSAIKEKAAQAVDATSGAYHETMAEHDASATQADVKAGDVTDAAANAKAAAEHKAKAVDAKASAKAHAAKAALHAKKAKVAAGITTDTEAK